MVYERNTIELLCADTLAGFWGIFGKKISEMTWLRAQRKFFGPPSSRHRDDPFFKTAELVQDVFVDYVQHRQHAWVFVIASDMVRACGHVVRQYGPFRKRACPEQQAAYCESYRALVALILDYFARRGRLLAMCPIEEDWILRYAFRPVCPYDIPHLPWPETADAWGEMAVVGNGKSERALIDGFVTQIRKHNRDRVIRPITVLQRLSQPVPDTEVIDPLRHVWFTRKRGDFVWPSFRSEITTFVRESRYYRLRLV